MHLQMGKVAVSIQVFDFCSVRHVEIGPAVLSALNSLCTFFADKQLPSSKSFYLHSLPQQSPLLTKDEYFPSSHIFRNRLFSLLQ